MMTIASQLVHSFQHHFEKLTDKRVWIACSGGRDSMALAFATFQLYQQGILPFCPQLIHVNHGLQSANDDWAKFVADWAKSLGIPCFIIDADFTVGNKQSNKVGLLPENSRPSFEQKKVGLIKINEQSARVARYQAIASIMNDNDVLMLAHHANDQAETVLMRLFNGAGVTGLSGMQAWTTKTVVLSDSIKTIHLWRPLLTATRTQITEYATQHDLAYVDDPTNLQGDNIRSWLRAELLPSIYQHYPQVIANTSRTASLLAEAKDILHEVYQQDYKLCTLKEQQLAPYDLLLDTEQVKRLSLARQRQLIHKWLQGDEPTPPTKLRVDEVMGLIHREDNDQQTELNWQGNNHRYVIRRYRNQLHRLREDWLAILQSKNLWKMDELADKLADINVKYSADTMSIRPLQKTDKFALRPNQQPQSGKKLMQQLGVPSWERQTVQVVASSSDDKLECVFTPRQSWHRESWHVEQK